MFFKQFDFAVPARNFCCYTQYFRPLAARRLLGAGRLGGPAEPNMRIWIEPGPRPRRCQGQQFLFRLLFFIFQQFWAKVISQICLLFFNVFFDFYFPPPPTHRQHFLPTYPLKKKNLIKQKEPPTCHLPPPTCHLPPATCQNLNFNPCAGKGPFFVILFTTINENAPYVWYIFFCPASCST